MEKNGTADVGRADEGEKNFVVCGWYTPDYAAWVTPLRASLDKVGAPHDFVSVDKRRGGWARNTLRKPAMMIQAMRRHARTTIIFLDVDAIVFAPLDDLAAIKTDIGLHMRLGKDRLGTPRLGLRSGTMVLRATDGTVSFLHRWAEFSDGTRRGLVDQNTLTMALARTPELTVTNLSVRFCATRADGVHNPVVAHERASAANGWAGRWVRTASRMTRFRPSQERMKCDEAEL
ncbi:MAG: putative nucleotide-diphospho-sugar transferase [Hyphomicrobiaceae bacterium]